MTRKLPHHRYEEMKRLAADLIEDYALAYPLDPLEVAAVLGVQVTIHPLGLPASVVVAAGTADGYTGAVDSAHGLRFHIHASGATAQARLRFTLVHELAHVWLDHHRSGGDV